MLCLFLLPEHHDLLGYLGWILQHSGLSLVDCEPEEVIEIVPELDNFTATQSVCAAQSIAQPKAGLNLIDL